MSGSRAASSLSTPNWEVAVKALAENGVFNLGIGQPAKCLLPMTAVQKAAADLSSYDPRYILQYGSMAGSAHYLEAVADFIASQLNGHAPAPANLFATPGNSAGLGLVARTLTRPGDRVLMEDPSYFLAHQVLRDYGVTLLPVKQRADLAGTLDVEAVAEALSHAKGGDGAPKLLYLVPTGNNPRAVTMPDADRARLVSLCAAHGVTIVADDVYELLQYDMAASPKPLRQHAAEQGVGSAVVSLGSWSKLLGPGLRLGWIEAEEALLERFAADGEVDSGSFTAPLVESLVTSLVTSGDAQAHVVSLRDSLRRRAGLLADAINAEQPPGTPPIVHAADAGYFLWVDTRGADAAALRESCAASYGVSFLPGQRCALDPSACATRLRVSYAFLETESELVEAGRRLGRAIAAAADS